ncbi:ROK family protein [Paenibacillus algorifonticola]|uniref:ROK family protein n=1 Tax=Paenibacillus algorifonticola TaxID=684063 RepID=UPI0018CCED3A|nr:ROK family protein [Paenibacillus algorifonticola]
MNPKLMGEMIRQQIRTALYYEHKSTKVEIAQITGLTFPTVSKAIEEMKADGEVLLSGLRESSGGRRPQIYMLNEAHMSGLAVYLEKDCTIYTLLNYVGEVMMQDKLPGVLDEGPEALERQMKDYLERYPLIRALTFGVPASVTNGQVFHIPSYEKFNGFDLKAAYESRYPLQVQIENDMNATVLGYHDQLDNNQELSLVYLYFGMNGPGAGIMVNGELVRGHTYFAGEIFYLPLFEQQSFGEVIRELAMGSKKQPHDPELMDAMSRLVAIFTATLNPDIFIFCSINLSEQELEEVKSRSAVYVPEAHLPKLMLRDWQKDYIHGLNQMTIRTMLGTGAE